MGLVKVLRHGVNCRVRRKKKGGFRRITCLYSSPILTKKLCGKGKNNGAKSVGMDEACPGSPVLSCPPVPPAHATGVVCAREEDTRQRSSGERDRRLTTARCAHRDAAGAARRAAVIPSGSRSFNGRHAMASSMPRPDGSLLESGLPWRVWKRRCAQKCCQSSSSHQHRLNMPGLAIKGCQRKAWSRVKCGQRVHQSPPSASLIIINDQSSVPDASPLRAQACENNPGIILE